MMDDDKLVEILFDYNLKTVILRMFVDELIQPLNSKFLEKKTANWDF